MASSGTTSTPLRFTGAEFCSFSGASGIRIVTGIPGGSILPVYDALSQSTQIRHILARHEQGAGFIAQGWRGRRVNLLFVWPVAGRARPIWSRLLPMRAGFHSVNLHYRASSGVHDRY